MDIFILIIQQRLFNKRMHAEDADFPHTEIEKIG